MSVTDIVRRLRGSPAHGAFRCPLCRRVVMESRRDIHEMVCPAWLSWTR